MVIKYPVVLNYHSHNYGKDMVRDYRLCIIIEVNDFRISRKKYIWDKYARTG